MSIVVTFLIVGIILIAIPIVCTMIWLYRSNHGRHAMQKTTKTTMTKSANGRTVFNASTHKVMPPFPPPPRVPPKAYGQSRATPKSWKRLSRPFSRMPEMITEGYGMKRWSVSRAEAEKFLGHRNVPRDLESGISPATPRYASSARPDSPMSPLSPLLPKNAIRPRDYSQNPLEKPAPAVMRGLMMNTPATFSKRAEVSSTSKTRKARPNDVYVGTFPKHSGHNWI